MIFSRHKMPKRTESFSRSRARAMSFAALGVVAAFAMRAEAAPSIDAQQKPVAPIQEAPTSEPLFRIVAFGSSSTEGIGSSGPAMTYPAQLDRLLNEPSRRGPRVGVVNRGIGGEAIDDMVGRLQADVIARKPDLIIWQVGSNDPLRGIPLDHFESELRRGLATIRAAGIEVVLLEPQWCPKLGTVDARHQFIDLVRKVGADQKVAVVRRYDLMQDWIAHGLVTEKGLIGPDGLHMTDRGYTLLAAAMAEEISGGSLSYRRARRDGAAVASVVTRRPAQ